MPKNLLLADDSITIQKVVGITFANEDYRVVSVDNGEDAIAKARELKPDVILADVVMPRKNGYEVCEAVKADPALARIPVLLLSGTFEAFDEGRARAARADGHIAKPFESQALISKVRELVEGTAPAAGVSAMPARPAPGPGARPGAMPPAGVRPSGPGGPAGFRPPGSGMPPGARQPGPPAGFRPPGPGMPPGSRPPGSWVPPGARPPAGMPPGARPPGPGMPPGARPPGPGMPPGARPPGAAPFARPPGPGMPPGARPPGGGMPPAARPPGPGGPAGFRPPGPGMPPGARPPAPRPFGPAPTRPATAPARSPTPAPTPARKDPFGFGLPAAPSAPPPPAEDDWSDVQAAGMKPLAKSAPEMGIELPEPPEAAPAPAPMELPEEHEEKLELASMQAFAPPPDAVGPEPEAPASALPEPIDLGAAQQVLRPGQAPSDGGEAVLRDALSKASQDVIEKVVWEVVPQLAETIIRENLDRLLKERQGT